LDGESDRDLDRRRPRREPLESPLFVLGLLAIVIAYIALGVAAARGRGEPGRGTPSA
jgi:hypothetical protein